MFSSIHDIADVICITSHHNPEFCAGNEMWWRTVDNIGAKFDEVANNAGGATAIWRRSLWDELRKRLGFLRTFHQNFVEGEKGDSGEGKRKTALESFVCFVENVIIVIATSIIITTTNTIVIIIIISSSIIILTRGSGTYEFRLSIHEERTVARWICEVIGQNGFRVHSAMFHFPLSYRQLSFFTVQVEAYLQMKFGKMLP
jgi:hypothetical protein